MIFFLLVHHAFTDLRVFLIVEYSNSAPTPEAKTRILKKLGGKNKFFSSGLKMKVLTCLVGKYLTKTLF